MLCGLTQVIGTFLSTILIEKYGRKVLLLISELSTCLSMLGVGIFFFLTDRCEDCQAELTPVSSGGVTVSRDFIENIGFLPLVCLMTFIAMFSLGLGPIPWILNVELIPSEAQVTQEPGYHCQTPPLSAPGCLLLPLHHLQLAGGLPGGSVRPHPGRHHRLRLLLLHLLGSGPPRHSLHLLPRPGDQGQEGGGDQRIFCQN